MLVLEAGKFPLSKVLISGGGRCNVMHDYDKGVDRIVRVNLLLNSHNYLTLYLTGLSKGKKRVTWSIQ